MPDDQSPLAATERAATAGEHAPVVVFLHGVGCARDQFAAQLAGLDRRLLLLSLDLPGHGESPPLPGGEYGVAAQSSAVLSSRRPRPVSGGGPGMSSAV
ncbi:hypothetical protein ACIBI7_33690 [Nonomuraea fuscirosea]|uniref:hypothetical protein n=1 Tax=Nonomuraea fuscirosea TaxID=1291556 RepID=UPI00379F12D8